MDVELIEHLAAEDRPINDDRLGNLSNKAECQVHCMFEANDDGCTGGLKALQEKLKDLSEVEVADYNCGDPLEEKFGDT